MKQIATEAIVLTRIDFGEAGRILTLLTKDQGKISALAKGVRKPKSKLAGGVELFTVADVVYFDGKSDIKTLVSAQLKSNYAGVAGDLTRSMTAYDVLKYTNLYTESVCEDAYFSLVQDVFEALDSNTANPAVVWVWFGIRLLEISGHAINTSSDSNSEQLKAEDDFSFDYQNMAFTPTHNGVYQASHIKLLRLCQTASLVQLKKVGGAGDAANSLKKLIAECINYSK